MKVAPCQARDLGNVQSISVWHVIGIAVDDSDGSPLNCLYLFCLCFGDEVVPNWSRVFQDWPNYYLIEVQQMGMWDTCSLQLFQKVNSLRRLGENCLHMD